jgi:hypothetical protein
MSLEDYLLMREVIAAIREGLPEADQLQAGQVFQHVLSALHDCSNKVSYPVSSDGQDAKLAADSVHAALLK